MAAPVKLKSFDHIVPMIYAYTTPGVESNVGWTKIGYTEKQLVEERIRQQTHTAGVPWELSWKDNAIYKDGSGEYFSDHDFHRYLVREAAVDRKPKTEWFKIDKQASRELFDTFATRSMAPQSEGATYILRKEQAEAVAMTKAYFEEGGEEFLWNAKPRFGKTLTAYDLVKQMGASKVLVLTNRPSIANAWVDDFMTFIGWEGQYAFVSETDAVKDRPKVLSRADYCAALATNPALGMIAFESLQGLKGSVHFGGHYDKLGWMANLGFDLLIVDEAQEGVDTFRTSLAFRRLKRQHTLYLSGTPFKALASERFGTNQIFNWSYEDEQTAKADWQGEAFNPYEVLPQLSLYTYQISNMMEEEVRRGIDLSGDGDTVDYAFDLNAFFETNESGKFVHEASVKRFLSALSTQEQYPFSTPVLRGELTHTLWLLNRVSSAKALAKLLKNDPVFGSYAVVVAAGDGRLSEDDGFEVAYDKVKSATCTHERTITLSVGQLTVGVTVPQWSGVLMLCNLTSPSSYMQAAFRVQNPCVMSRGGQRFRKEMAYVFDFDPARTLTIFDEFANNLSPEVGHGTGDERKAKIRRLLNFFPVLGEDEQGSMVPLDASQVLTIPRRLKSQEVVRRGFMSNFLFQNITNIFGAPGVVQDIMGKMTPAQEESKNRRNDGQDDLQKMSDVMVDDQGDVVVSGERVIGRTVDLFGDKIYEDLETAVSPSIEQMAGDGCRDDLDAVIAKIDAVAQGVTSAVVDQVVAPLVEHYGVKTGEKKRLEKMVEADIQSDLKDITADYTMDFNIAQAELNQIRETAEVAGDVAQAEEDFDQRMEALLNQFKDTVSDVVHKVIEEKPTELVERMEKQKAKAEKKSVEDTVRSHLRGFSRTIPSFIMAYGDEKLTLANFEVYTEDAVFEEVTGITEAEFCFLRDGGDYKDPDTGAMVHFEGHLFDTVVFDDAIQAFLKKKAELADYFNDDQKEDIFDYIPPQKTNQIYTPKWVAAKMVDDLEAHNPGCFDDPEATFADLYMKSGIYMTEIVKRLFQSEGLKATFPDKTERINHIIQHQVYGMAPTRIIFLIATNYILGFDADLKENHAHFVQADAAEAATAGTLEELVKMYFGSDEGKNDAL